MTLADVRAFERQKQAETNEKLKGIGDNWYAKATSVNTNVVYFPKKALKTKQIRVYGMKAVASAKILRFYEDKRQLN